MSSVPTPPVVDVVPADVVDELIGQVRASLARLEEELAAAKAATRSAPIELGAIGDEVLRLADQLTAEADAYAARVLAAAHETAMAITGGNGTIRSIAPEH